MHSRVFFITILCLIVCSVSVPTASAQKVLKRPLQYVPADSVFVLPKGDQNIIMNIMAVAPFATPQPVSVSKADRQAAKRDLALGPDDERVFDRLPVFERTIYNARMLLLTGHSCYAELLEHAYFKRLPAALVDDGILPHSEREAAAQQLLDLTGTIFATDGRSDVYVNFFENCFARISMKKFRMLLDIVSGYPDSQMVKLRIDGLNAPNSQFALHIRVPEKGAPKKFYINGHEVIRPVYENGYFVIDRKWHNGEEVYFVLEEI